MRLSFNLRAFLEELQPLHKKAFMVFSISLILIETLWSGESAFLPFITYKSGNLLGQWQGLGEALSMFGTMISPFLAAHLLRHRHYLSLVLLSTFLMVGAVFYFKTFEKSKLEILSFAWVSIGTGLMYTLVKTGLNKSMPLQNTFFVWTCIGILEDIGEGFGIHAAGSLSPTPFLILMGIVSASVGIPLLLFRTLCSPLFESVSSLVSKKQGGEIMESLQHMYSCCKQLKTTLSLAALIGFLNIWTLFSEYSIDRGFSRDFYSQMKLYILVCTMIFVPLFSFVSRKWTSYRVMGFLGGLLVIGALLMLGFKSTWSLWLGATFLQIAEIALAAFISHLLTQASRLSAAVSFGFGFSLVSLVEGVSGTLGSFLNQWVFDHISPQAVGFLWTGITISYLCWFFLTHKDTFPSLSPSSSDPFPPSSKPEKV